MRLIHLSPIKARVEYKRAIGDSLIVNNQQYGKRDPNFEIYLFNRYAVLNGAPYK